MGRERCVGQLGARVGRAHGQVRRYFARAYSGRVPAGVERGFAAARQCEQRQHAQGEFEPLFSPSSLLSCLLDEVAAKSVFTVAEAKGAIDGAFVPSGVGETPLFAS